MSRDEMELQNKVMDSIKTGKIKMRSRWYFISGTIALIAGTAGCAILAVFLVSLLSFSLRTHGPMGSYRLQQILASFPWWAALLGVVGLAGGILLLKMYDFSYKKNFWLIVAGFLIAVIIAGVAIDYTGLDAVWMKRGPMQGYYRMMGGQGAGMGQGNGIGSGQGRGMMNGNQ
jgi:hypothetical protein